MARIWCHILFIKITVPDYIKLIFMCYIYLSIFLPMKKSRFGGDAVDISTSGFGLILKWGLKIIKQKIG